MTAGLHRAQEDQDLEHGAAGVAGALSVVGLAAAITHDMPTGAMLGSDVTAHGGVLKVPDPLHVLCSPLDLTIVLPKGPATAARECSTACASATNLNFETRVRLNRWRRCGWRC